MAALHREARRPRDPLADDGFEVSHVPDDGAESNGSSAPSTVNSRCGPSGIGCPTGCAPRCSFGRCPCYLSWYLKQALAPILCHDHDEPAAGAQGRNPVVATPRWPRPPANAPPTTTPAQLHQPARRPGHHLRQPCSARPRHASVHHDHHAHPASAVGLRTTRRLPPSRPGVVSTPTPPDHKTPAQHPTRHQTGNFGLPAPDAWWKDHNWHSSEEKLTPLVRICGGGEDT